MDAILHNFVVNNQSQAQILIIYNKTKKKIYLQGKSSHTEISSLGAW